MSTTTLTTQQAKRQVLTMTFMDWSPLKNEVKFLNTKENDISIAKTFEVKIQSPCVGSESCVWSVTLTQDKIDGSLSFYDFRLPNVKN